MFSTGSRQKGLEWAKRQLVGKVSDSPLLPFFLNRKEPLNRVNVAFLRTTRGV